MLLELFFGLSFAEKVVPKPYFSQVSFVLVRGIYLLYSIKGFRLKVKTFPNLGKATPPELLPLQIPVHERFILYLYFL